MSMQKGRKRSTKSSQSVASDMFVGMPLVTVITPCHREVDYANILNNYRCQDYSNCEFVAVFDDGMAKFEYGDLPVTACYLHTGVRLGIKRNWACVHGTGEFIVHMDSDDVYSSSWVSDSVRFLRDNPSVLVTGLSSVCFRDVVVGQDYLYEYKGTQPYVVGATMAYRRDFWDRVRFGDVSVGEDTEFVLAAGFGVRARSGYSDFLAILNGNNVSSHTHTGGMRRL